MKYDLDAFCESLAKIERILGENAAAAAALQRSVRDRAGEPMTRAQLEAATALVESLDAAIHVLNYVDDPVLDYFACIVDVLAGRQMAIAGDLMDRAEIERRVVESRALERRLGRTG